ncbi:uncharacterized mitochondrial protein AtMg00810-like [Miscanthus floridulus]|uniref:uncharacterized mitochondrial protein AtMg00810-like n=1 Tax=Miscanthus floridulus TaxID=154761 RepID=UPI003457A78F
MVGSDIAYLLLYVDDIVLTASSTSLLRRLTELLHSEFAMTDLGDLHHFLGISITRSADGLFLSQCQYVVDLLQHAGMAECHSTATPVDTQAKLSAMDGAPVADVTQYHSLTGALQYLTLTCPDLAYAVQQVCLFMHNPREPHLVMPKHVLRYVKGTLSTGLHIGTGSITSLTAYSDADWLLQELHAPISSATIVYCDNVSAVYMTANPVHHRRTKHIEIDIHFVREKVALG